MSAVSRGDASIAAALVGGKRKLLAHLLRRLFREDSPIFRPSGFSCGNILGIAARVGVGRLRFVGVEVVRLARDLLDERRLVEQFDNRRDAFSVRTRRVPSAPKRMI